ncbi:MAG: alpha/beta hydrolase [Pseudomonadota bacterium]
MQSFTQNDQTIAYEVVGDGPPVLLLHGFPQTRALWRQVAPRLASRNTLILPDLRGYGASSKPAARDDLENYSFRAMGADMLSLMTELGHRRFHLVGHDRGGRVAHRMALDAQDRIESLTVMDIVPTLYLLEHWSAEVSRAYFHWSFLAQPAPLPERMIGADPDQFFERCLLGWGGAALVDFAELAAYRTAWRDPETIAGMVNDYRAAVTVDLGHDRTDRDRRVDCPSLVLYGASGAMARHFDVGATWASSLSDYRTEAIPGGHFFVDQSPEATARSLAAFLDSVPMSG